MDSPAPSASKSRDDPYLRAQEQRESNEIQTFECSFCGLHAPYDYYGNSPKYSGSITFTEQLYVMRDPFSPFDRTVSTNYLVLGGHCAHCNALCCVDATTCSLFYEKRLCVDCAKASVQLFPAEVQKEIGKMKKTEIGVSTLLT